MVRMQFSEGQGCLTFDKSKNKMKTATEQAVDCYEPDEGQDESHSVE